MSCPTIYQATPRGSDCGIFLEVFDVDTSQLWLSGATVRPRQRGRRGIDASGGPPGGHYLQQMLSPSILFFLYFPGLLWFQPESFKLFQTWLRPKGLVRERSPHKKILVHVHFWFYYFLPIDIKKRNEKSRNSHLSFLPPQHWDFHGQWTTLLGVNCIHITKLLSPRWFSTWPLHKCCS